MRVRLGLGGIGEGIGVGANCFHFYDAFYLVNDFDVDNFNRKQLEAPHEKNMLAKATSLLRAW